VGIRWKKGKDLTGGLLDLVCKAWDADREAEEAGGSKITGMSPAQKALKKKIDQTGMGGLSFFAWFGFIGRRVSERESEEATRREAERREERKGGAKIESPVEEEAEEADEEGGANLDMSLEIFPDGDDLAVAITEDLWPGAIKYFSQSSRLSLPLPLSHSHAILPSSFAPQPPLRNKRSQP
jgi:hypothetical protein